MRLSKILLFFLIFLMKPLSLHAQCPPAAVNEIISIDDFPIERNGLSTESSGDDFIVFGEGGTDVLGGYASNDYIFQFTLGYTDADPDDVENNDNADAISIFVDMCNNDVTFDASIAIVRAQAHDQSGNDVGGGIDCSNIAEDELIIPDYSGSLGIETVDSGALCPEATGFTTPEYLPIARDIYLEEPGIYYIVVEGHSPGEGFFGEFDLVIDYMSHFEEYPLDEPHQPNNLYVDIEFSTEIYGVNDDQPWSVGAPLNAPDYFRAFDENGNAVGIGNLIDLSNGPLQPNTGYSAIRFPLIDQPDHGASIYLTTVNHDFISGDYVTNAPHPVNSNGIPFTIEDTIEIELHDIIPPTINIIGVSDNGDPAIVDPDESFIITSSEPLLRDGEVITAGNINDYITAQYVDGTPINFSLVVNDDQTEITIVPSDPSSMNQWQDVSITLVNEVDNITITDDPDILHEHADCPGPNVIEDKTSIIRVNDIIPPSFSSASVNDDTNTLVTITMNEATYSGLNESGGLDASHFGLSLSANESNNVQSVTIENVIQENSIQTLTGGEMTFRLQLILNPPEASGSEEITISPTISPIYDRAGNQVLNQLTVTFNDELAPSVSINPVSSGPIMPNTDFVLTFSESIKRYQVDNSFTDLNIDDITSIISLINQAGDPIDYDATLILNATVITINPDDDLNELENVTLSFSGSEFCDQGMNLVSSEEVEYIVADITPPGFDEVQVDDPLSRGNDHITIIISEPIYTDPSATGAVNVDDFNLVVDYDAEAGAGSISIESIADESGGIPIGGETILRLNLSIIGSPNGMENVSVKAALNQIYDLGGNAMSANEALGPFDLYPAPLFSQDSILSEDNSYIRLVFENGPVYHSEDTSLSIRPQDFMVQLTNSDGDISEIEPTYISIVDENDVPVSLFKGAHNVKFNFLDLGFIPKGDETIMIFPQSSNAIYNKDGVSMDESESAGPFTLNDQLKPFYNINIADGDTNVSNNDTILLTFNEPICLLNEEALDDDSAMENFEIWDVSRTDTIIMTTPDGNTIIPPDQPIPYDTFRTIVDDPGPDSIWVIMDEPFGSEHIMSITIKNNFEDENGNQLLENDTISFKSRDNISPDFVSGSARIDSAVYLSVQSNPSESARKICFVNLSINDNVFTDTSLTGPVQAGDFNVGIIQNGGSVTSGDIEYLELVDNGNSEHDAIRFKIRFDEIPSGSESLFISTANNNSIFDSGLNFMNADSTSDTLTIYDLRFPTIDSTSIEHEGFIDLMSDSTILVYFSEPIVTNSFSYELKSKLDVSGFNHKIRLSSDSLTILLDSTIMSYDTLELNIVSIEDTSGNQRDSLLLRRFFTKAAGDFSMPPDDRVSLEDLNIFISAWNSGDYSKNLGPYAGTPPNIKITQDNLFGIDDGMAFTQMWLWSLQEFGPSDVPQQLLVNSPSSIAMRADMITILPPNNAISGQIKIEYNGQFHTIVPGGNSEIKSNGILLSNNDDQNGLAFIEYALTENKQNPIYFNINKNDQEDSEVKVSYSFFDEDFRLISKGDSILYNQTIPTEFSLIQNYPNPFNPKTNIRFALPKDSFVKLNVYDVNGKLVDEIVNGYLEPGIHNVEWSGTDTGGIDVSSGVYFYRIEASNYSKTYKMVFVK